MCYMAGHRLFKEGLPLVLVDRRKVWGKPVVHKSLPGYGICEVPLQSLTERLWSWASFSCMVSLAKECALMLTVEQRAGRYLRNIIKHLFTLHPRNGITGGKGHLWTSSFLPSASPTVHGMRDSLFWL